MLWVRAHTPDTAAHSVLCLLPAAESHQSQGPVGHTAVALCTPSAHHAHTHSHSHSPVLIITCADVAPPPNVSLSPATEARCSQGPSLYTYGTGHHTHIPQRWEPSITRSLESGSKPHMPCVVRFVELRYATPPRGPESHALAPAVGKTQHACHRQEGKWCTIHQRLAWHSTPCPYPPCLTQPTRLPFPNM